MVWVQGLVCAALQKEVAFGWGRGRHLANVRTVVDALPTNTDQWMYRRTPTAGRSRRSGKKTAFLALPVLHRHNIQ